MRAVRYIPLALLLVAVSTVVLADGGWQDNTDAAGYYLWNLPAPSTVPVLLQDTAPLLYGGHAAASLVSNPNASTGAAIDVTLGNGLGFFFPAPGVNQLQNTSPLFGLAAIPPIAFDGVNTVSGPGVLYTGGTLPVDLGTSVSNAIVACSTSGSVCSPTGVVVAGGLHYASGTLTDAAFSCGSNTWVSSTSTSGPSCTQPAVGNLQNIAAHTIVANATALAAPPAQTSIGTTEAFDGTGQLQCVGLRDGGGVNHVTTGTWPVSSLLGTNVSGQIATQAATTCAQTGPAIALVDGGSCSGQQWTTSGSWAAGQYIRTDVGGSKILTPSTIAGDGTSISCSNTGIPPLNLTCGVVSGYVATQATKMHWMILDNVPAASRWIVTSSAAFTGLAALEYPNDFLAGHVLAKADFIASIGAGNFSCFVTRNGSGIAGTSLTYSGTLGIQSTATVSTGSASINDAYGVECSPSAGGGGTINFSFEVVLAP